ncbi:unnamed protein product [Thelazia callipaeda]|uniref:DUF384 domain-containing protein n=1 Tax=Thelazia callipaeda TaxID=103827 RepID=A0A0N5CZV6_THECL|nr:unnamed protein product [Thelazia callipaeda]
MLCGSKFGLDVLRTKGIYALLREFDRAKTTLLHSESVTTEVLKSQSSVIKTEKNSAVVDWEQSRCQSAGHQNVDEVKSTADNNREMAFSSSVSKYGVKLFGKGGNLVYIDGKNCSTLHALIGLLIQD